MTTLFEEYEQIKSLPNLIGKKFYWSNNFLNDGPFERNSFNEFVIVKCNEITDKYENSIVYYEYLRDHLPGSGKISKLLKYATPIDD